MKKRIKVLSVILAVLTLFGVFSVATPVFAAEISEETELNTEIIEETEENAEDTEKEEVESEASAEEAEIICEIEEMRTADTKYFRLSDGSYMAASYTAPVHYKENGEWKEYDYSIEERVNEEEFVIENTDQGMTFPEEFKEDNSEQISVSADEYEIKFSPVVENKLFKKTKGEARKSEELKSNRIRENFSGGEAVNEKGEKPTEKNKMLMVSNQKSALTYENIYNEVDIEYEVSPNKIKESIVLNSKQDKNKFEFVVDTDGLYPKKEKDGSIMLYSDKECTKSVSLIEKPYMYDSNGEYSYDVEMDITEKKGNYILTVKASNNWLNDKERVYPVVIDPTIILDVARDDILDNFVLKEQPNSTHLYEYQIYAGVVSVGTTRAFVKFKLPTLPDGCSVIQNASVHFTQKSALVGDGKNNFLNVHKVKTAWSNANPLSWNNQPTYESNLVLDYCEITKSGVDEYWLDITKTVKEWYEGEPNNGIALVSANESESYGTQIYSGDEYDVNAYPMLTVTFRNNKGLEGYWSYSSYSIDTAGAAHINDYTGNLVYELPLISSVGERMPLTLKAYYNSYCAGEKFSAGKNNSSKTTPGKGFRLSIQETVLPSTEYGLTGSSASNYPYVYTDGDGTEHYIRKVTEDGNTVYKDEDGLGLTLIKKDDSSYKYRISDKNGNLRYFNEAGNLFSLKDANGNVIQVNFQKENGATGYKIIDNIVDGTGRKFTFGYYETSGVNNGYIKTITDSAGRVTTLYTSSGLLNYVTYPDGTKTTIDYGTSTSTLINYVEANDGYKLNFDYSTENGRYEIKAVKEYGGDNIGQVVTFNRSAYNKTVVRTSGLDGYNYALGESGVTADKGDDDIVTTLQFDNFGKTISQQVSYGSGAEIGASNYTYTSGSSTLGSANKVSSSASLGKNTVNLLSNSNAESTSDWSFVKSSTVTATGAAASVYHTGKKSLQLKNTAFSSNGVSYFRQNLANPTVGKRYTFSAYVRTGSLTKKYSSSNAGAYIQLATYDSAGTAIDSVYSEKITDITDTSINNGWRRLSVTVEIASNVKTLSAYICLRDMTGAAYFDSMQLEVGSVSSGYNMLSNSSFEKHSSYLPSLWTAVGDFSVKTASGTVLDGVSTGSHKAGSTCLRISGEPAKSKGICQTVPVAPNAKDTYILSGWGAAYAVNDTFHQEGNKTMFEIAVGVKYTCTDTATGATSTVTQYKKSAKFNTTISGWQYSSTSFALKYTSPESGKTYTPQSIMIIPKYSYQENYAYFDHLQLIKDVAQTYTYDKKGNLVATSANSEQKVNAEYNDNNDLTSYTDTAGFKSTATYDDNHNLLTTKSARGLTTKNTYNAYGSPTVTEVQNSSGSAVIKTSRTYNKERSEGGVTLRAGSELISTKDERGYVTKYSYDLKTGVPLTTTNAKGVITENGYNSNNTRLSTVLTTNIINGAEETTKLRYLYDGNRVSSIDFYGTGKKIETYSFVYDNYGNVTETKVGSQRLAKSVYAG
ncbi:MAG: RHS repeat protein, partial [Clostridia bacterium]|nr:RHS repeat protein [Clostridia bacterium]